MKILCSSQMVRLLLKPNMMYMCPQLYTHIHKYKTLSYTCKYSCRLSLSRTLRHGYMLIHPSAGIRSLNRLYLWIPEWLVSLKAYLAFKARVRLHVFRGKHFPGALG